MSQFRILSSGAPVGTVRAENREEALQVFTDGRGLPDGVDLTAYAVSALETRRPRAGRGWRA